MKGKSKVIRGASRRDRAPVAGKPQRISLKEADLEESTWGSEEDVFEEKPRRTTKVKKESREHATKENRNSVSGKATRTDQRSRKARSGSPLSAAN